MAKRRTRKQKESAKHAFTISWKPGLDKNSSKAKSSLNEPTVKGQFPNKKIEAPFKAKKKKNPDSMAKDGYLSNIKRDIIKSLSLALIIVGFELMIYLALR